MQPQLFIDHRQGVVGPAHPGGADRMKDRGADIAGGLGQGGVIIADRGAGQIFLGMILRQRRLAPSAGG